MKIYRNYLSGVMRAFENIWNVNSFFGEMSDRLGMSPIPMRTISNHLTICATSFFHTTHKFANTNRFNDGCRNVECIWILGLWSKTIG